MNVILFVLVGLVAGLVILLVRRGQEVRKLERTVEAALGSTSTDRTRSETVITRTRKGIAELWKQRDHLRVSLEKEQAAVRETVNVLGEAVLHVTSSRRIVSANRRAAEIFGVTDTLAGGAFVDFVRTPEVLNALDRAIAGKGTDVTVTLRIAGSDRRLEFRFKPLPGEGEPRLVVVIADLTRIEQLETIRRDFIDDFSHEARTPIAALRSALESFDSGPLSVEQEGELRQIMLRQVKRLERLVERLAELAHLESGELVLHREHLEILRVLTDVCDDFREIRPNTAITVEGPEATAWGDLSTIQQIFTNLIDNALKHSGSNEVHVRVVEDNEFVVVSVSDRGIGIPVEEHERVFNRFYRIDKSRSQDTPGTGLGLAITKHLVLLNNGTIELRSKPGLGATFEVRLPKNEFLVLTS